MNSQHVRFKLPERLAATRSHGPIPAQTRLSTPSRHHRVLIKASNDNESDNQGLYLIDDSVVVAVISRCCLELFETYTAVTM